jgi:hypothetical protein
MAAGWWAYGPYLKARYEVARLIRPGLLGRERPLSDATALEVRVNTYTHQIPSACIASLYNAACARLGRLHEEGEMKTYSWQDEIGCPLLATVVQAEGRYMVAGVIKGNDSDAFWCHVRDGVFDVSGKQQEATWEIPPGTLRDD